MAYTLQRPAGSGGVQTIVDVSATYQILPIDDIVNATGTFVVTLPAIATATREVTISCVTGSITVAGDAAIQEPTRIRTGSSNTFYAAGAQWRQK